MPPETQDEEGVIYVEDWDGIVTETKTYETYEERPYPYIIDFSPTGLMQIGWSNKMNPPSKISDIPPALFALQIDDQS